jgi:tetratricopeptide (TPR) repeat protein
MAISWYLKAVENDFNYFDPMIGLSSAHAALGNLEEDLKWVIRYYKKRDLFPLVNQLWASWAYAYSFEPPEEGFKYLKQLQQIDDQNPGAAYILGITSKELGLYDKAIPEFEKSLMIYHKWGKSFLKDNPNYSNLGACYHFTGQFKNEITSKFN